MDVEACPEGGPGTVVVSTKEKRQKITGFGGAFTDATTLNFYQLPEEIREKVLDAYFAPWGIEYSMGRIPMGSCGFSVEQYSFAEVPGDYNLKHFDVGVGRDVVQRIPMILGALKREKKLKLIVSPWSPPAWMKEPRDGEQCMVESAVPQGLLSDPGVHSAWALFFSLFITAYKSLGIDIWGLTIQSESEKPGPWEACVYTPRSQAEFLRNYLGPRIRRDHPDVKIMPFDHNRDNLVEWAEELMRDEETAQYVDGVAFHWYSGGEERALDGSYGWERLNATHELLGDEKFLLSTESCNCPFVEESLEGGWGRAESVAHDIIADLNNWVVGWVDWNLLLSHEGGPNHAGSLCDSPVIVNEELTDVTFQPMFYFMGHISKFAKPGARVLKSRVTGSYLEAGRRSTGILPGFEAALYGCEGSVRQAWELDPDTGHVILADYFGRAIDGYLPLCLGGQVLEFSQAVPLVLCESESAGIYVYDPTSGNLVLRGNGTAATSGTGPGPTNGEQSPDGNLAPLGNGTAAASGTGSRPTDGEQSPGVDLRPRGNATAAASGAGSGPTNGEQSPGGDLAPLGNGTAAASGTGSGPAHGEQSPGGDLGPRGNGTAAAAGTGSGPTHGEQSPGGDLGPRGNGTAAASRTGSRPTNGEQSPGGDLGPRGNGTAAASGTGPGPTNGEQSPGGDLAPLGNGTAAASGTGPGPTNGEQSPGGDLAPLGNGTAAASGAGPGPTNGEQSPNEGFGPRGNRTAAASGTGSGPTDGEQSPDGDLGPRGNGTAAASGTESGPTHGEQSPDRDVGSRGNGTAAAAGTGSGPTHGKQSPDGGLAPLGNGTAAASGTGSGPTNGEQSPDKEFGPRGNATAAASGTGSGPTHGEQSPDKDLAPHRNGTAAAPGVISGLGNGERSPNGDLAPLGNGTAAASETGSGPTNGEQSPDQGLGSRGNATAASLVAHEATGSGPGEGEQSSLANAEGGLRQREKPDARVSDVEPLLCLGVLKHSTEDGAILTLAPCGVSGEDGSADQKWVFPGRESGGEVGPGPIVAESTGQCMTAGWPFFTGVAFKMSDESRDRYDRKFGVVLLNEAEESVRFNLSLPEEEISVRAKIGPRTIQTMLV